MADDITLTVRVRDMTRGEFADIRRRMRGMDGDIRGLANSSNLASERADRLSRSIRGVSGRLGQLRNTGQLAGHEMDYMRRSMGLLDRDLRMAARSGEISREEFGRLRDQLDETRLGFDRLDNEMRRHSAVAQRRAREAAARQREERRQQERHGQAIVNDMRRVSRAHEAALRENARREAAAARDVTRRQMAQARGEDAHRRRIMRAWDAALREDAARARRQEAEGRRAGQRLAQIMQQQENDLRRHLSRMASMSDADRDLNRRFRGMDDGSMRRMTGTLSGLARRIDDLNGSTSGARRTIAGFGRDMDFLSQALQNAARDGNLTRREFNALSRTLDDSTRTLSDLRRSRSFGRSTYRQMRDDVQALRAQLQLLDRDGTVFQRLASRMLLFQRRLRETRNDGNILRRSLNRMGDGMVGGMRRGVMATGLMIAAMRKLGSIININKRWTAILLAVLLLLGPAAQVLAGLLIGVLGAAFIALGAFALRGSQAVKDAFKDMKSSVSRDLADAAQPMRTDLVFGIRQITDAVKEMKPALAAAFAATGPLIEPFVGAVTDLVKGALPGFTTALSQAGPAMEGFRTGLGLLGKGLGDMFAAMTAGGGAEALKQTWILMGEELNNFLVGLGEFMNMAMQSGTATLLLVGVLRAFSGVLNLVEFGLRTVDALFGGLFMNLSKNIIGFSDLIGGVEGLGTTFVAAGQDVDTLRQKLDKVEDRIARIKKIREDTEDIPGPVRDDRRGRMGASDADLKRAEQERAALTAAIAAAENEAATATYDHAAAVDRLRQSIADLNKVNLTALDRQAAMEEAIDKAVEKANELAGKISISDGGILNVDTEAGRQAQEVLSGIASSTQEYVDALIEANAPQEQINAAWRRGREQMLGLADNFRVSEAAMRAYADQVLQTPESVTTTLRVEKEQAEAAAQSAINKIKKVPKEQRSRAVFEAHRALERMSQVESRLNALDGKTAHTYVTNTTINEIITKSKTYRSVHDIVGATGGMFTGRSFKFAQGGEVSGLIRGPGTGTSDEVFAPWLSNGEFVIRASMVNKYGEDFLQKLNAGVLDMPKFAKGGSAAAKKKAKAKADAQVRKEALKELRSDVTFSHFGKMAGYQNTEFRNAVAKSDTLGEVVSGLNRMRSQIKQASSGKTESTLLKRLDTAGRSLINHQKKLVKVNASLEKAKDKLNELTQSAKALREGIKNGILQETNITRSASSEESRVTINTIMSQMTANAANAKQFSSMLDQLKKRGLSGDLIAQIAEAGIEGGGMETAAAILGGGKAEIARLNALQKDINKFADSAGKTASDAMYGAGIKAAKGLVDGLTKQKKQIEATMMAIAKSMEKAIKKALGIKSPSRVMEAVGKYTAEGFALGIERNMHPQQAVDNMMAITDSKRRIAQPVTNTRDSGQPMVIQLQIGSHSLGEIIIDPLRKSIRHRGGNVQAVLGK